MEDFKFLKIMKFFLKNPYEEVYLRQLAKKVNLSPYATKKYVDILIKETLVCEERRANLRYFKANVDNIFFKHVKISFNMGILVKSKLIDYLKQDIVNVSSVVLFGSAAKGQDSEESDIDIVVIGKKKEVNLKEFEKKINKDINLHIFSWNEWNKQAKDNMAFYYDVILQGIALYGELPVVK